MLSHLPFALMVQVQVWYEDDDGNSTKKATAHTEWLDTRDDLVRPFGVCGDDSSSDDEDDNDDEEEAADEDTYGRGGVANRTRRAGGDGKGASGTASDKSKKRNFPAATGNSKGNVKKKRV